MSQQILGEIGAWAGIVGFTCLGLLIFSGDTARWWDRYFGMDRIIKAQRKFSLFMAAIVLLHPISFMVANSNVAGFLVPDFSMFPFAMGIMSLYVLIAIMIASQLYKRISHAAWQYIHVLTYILYFSVLYHAYFWGTDAKDLIPLFSIVTLLVLIGIVYRTKYKLRQRLQGPATLLKITEDTHDTFTLHVKTKEPLEFISGQFCFLRIDKHRLYARHPFSISNAPGCDVLEFTIKQSGRFTKIARTLQPGTPIYVDGPFGIFTPPDEGSLVFVAGGVGITPFLSILRDRAARRIDQPITLIYGSRSKDDIIGFTELEKLDHPWLKKAYVLNDDRGVDFPHEKGIVTGALIEKHVPDIQGKTFNICGPERMKDSVKRELKAMGVPRSRIKIEDFFW